MAEKHASVNNKKYSQERRRKEAVSAIGFLLPNLVGFMVVTFIPIFATFFLSFTKWDGKSGKAQSQIKVAFSTDNPAEQNIKLPKEGKIIYQYPKKEYWQKEITLPYILSRDVIISQSNGTVGISDIVALKEWDYKPEEQVLIMPSNDKILELSEQYNLDISPEDLPFIKPGKIYFNATDITATMPRFVNKIDGIGTSLILDMNNSGNELNVVAQNLKAPVTIPKGTVILANLNIKTIESISTQRVEYLFANAEKQGTIIKKGKTNSKKILLVSEQSEQLHSNVPRKIKRYLSYENIPENLTVDLKMIAKTGNDGIKWVGLQNYKKILLTDSRFRDYLLNTLFFLIIVPIGMAISLILAMAMNQPLKGIVTFRVLYFLPVISNIVAVALVWRWILNSDYGLLNQALRFIGMEHPPQWFSQEWPARFAIVIVEVWKGAGYNMMLYLAGLQGIPHFLYEAADIDGASPWQQFWNITWPLLGPTNFFVLIMGIIGGFQAFGTQFVLTNGGPKGATTTIVYYIYNNAFQWGKMGYATAIAVVLFVFVMIITAVQWRINEGNVEY